MVCRHPANAVDPALAHKKEKPPKWLLRLAFDRRSVRTLFVVFRLIVVILRLVLCLGQFVAFHSYGLLSIGLRG